MFRSAIFFFVLPLWRGRRGVLARRAGASAELHMYATGGHGFGVRSRNTGPIGGWTDRFLEWLESKQFLASKQGK